MDQEVLTALARYNAYANQLVLQAAGQLTEAQYVYESRVSHSSVHKMLVHMRVIERGYLAQCQGVFPHREELRNLEEVRVGLSETDQKLAAYIETLEPAVLDQEVELRLLDLTLCLPVWKALLQVLMHTTHHRGELSILLTELGRPLPTMDIIVQFSEEMGQPWPWK